MTKSYYFILLAIVAFALLVLVLLPENSVHVSANSAFPSEQKSAHPPNIDPDVSITDLSQLKTFRATGTDGVLATDESNKLIVDRQLRFWIDFHLAALGEIPLAQIKQFMMSEIADLPQPGRDQAIQILNHYLSYKAHLAEHDASAGSFAADLEGMQARFEWQKRLRREWLQPETVEAFWHMDESIDGLVLNKLMIRNSDLDEQQKQQAIEQLEQQMPEEWLSFRQQAVRASELESQVAEMRSSSEFDEEDIREHRLASVGEEATLRLENLDRQQQQWQQRIIALIAEEQRINNIEGIDSSEKASLIEDYQKQSFSEAERLRLDAAKQMLSESNQ